MAKMERCKQIKKEFHFFFFRSIGWSKIYFWLLKKRIRKIDSRFIDLRPFLKYENHNIDEMKVRHKAY